MSQELLSDFVFTNTYARYDESKRRRETFPEAVHRMVEMHVEKYGEAHRPLIEDAFSSVKEKKVLASQRALQFGGEPVLKNNMRIYNCATSYCDRLDFFKEAFFMGLCGVGVGFSVQDVHISRLPPLLDIDELTNCVSVEYVIEDSIEGWANALGALIDSFFYSDVLAPDFDFSQIRPKGAPLSSGGKAPGPEPLEAALEKVSERLLRCIESGQDRLTSLDCLDIAMFASQAVLSGGRRRAATIAIFDKDDELMLNAKTGDWFTENSQRGLVNISAALVDGQYTREELDRIIRSTREFGEPGIVFTRSQHYLYNPCVEIGMCPILIKDADGKTLSSYSLDVLHNRELYEDQGYTYDSGWQCCNLTEINGGAIKEASDLNEAARAASIIGTLQAGFTTSAFLGDVTKQIIERESLLGVSITGFMDSPAVLFNKENLKTAAEIAIKTNEETARAIGIPTAARVTCVKPAGTTSIILGTASGIHPHHARRMIRRVQVNKMSPVYKFFSEINPGLCEDCQWSSGNDAVIAFPIVHPEHSLVKSQISAIDFLRAVVNVQESWVQTGRARPSSCEGLQHNVSNTVKVGEDEWEAVTDFLWDHSALLTGVSMLGDGEIAYPQLPMQEILLPEKITQRFGAAAHALAKVDDYEMAAKELPPEESIDMLRFFVDGYQLWCKVLAEAKPVNYAELVEDQDNTRPTVDPACAGGSCEIAL